MISPTEYGGQGSGVEARYVYETSAAVRGLYL